MSTFNLMGEQMHLGEEPALEDLALLKEALTVNQGSYNELATEYIATGSDRLNQALRWFSPALTTISRDHHSKQILELGSADGFLTGYLANLGHQVTAIDFASSMVSSTRHEAPAAQVIEKDFLDANLSNTFDLVICSAFAHLFPSPWDLRVLEKCARLLNDDGIAFISTTLHEEASSGFEVKDGLHCRFRNRYTLSNFKELMRQAGLEEISFSIDRDALAPEKTWGNWIMKKATS